MLNPTSTETRGISCYCEVNWYFKGRILTFWLSGRDKTKELAVEHEISCVAVG